MQETMENRNYKHIIAKCRERIANLSEITGRKFNVTAEDLYTYLTAENYRKDLYTVEDILSNDYILFHELVEIEILKNSGLRITSKVIVENPDIVYAAHLDALEEELEVAFNRGDFKWIKSGIRDIERYLEDEYLPSKLRDKVLKILKEYRTIV